MVWEDASMSPKGTTWRCGIGLVEEELSSNKCSLGSLVKGDRCLLGKKARYRFGGALPSASSFSSAAPDGLPFLLSSREDPALLACQGPREKR